MNDRDLLDHGRRIAELERKVTELYSRLGQAEPASGFASDRGSGFAEPAAASASEDPRVIDAIQRGNKIGAIKTYREITGVGLAEAKDAVEELERSYRPT